MNNIKLQRHPSLNNTIVHNPMDNVSKYQIHQVKIVNFSGGQNYTFPYFSDNIWGVNLPSVPLFRRHCQGGI